jgi:hypothetical protein
MIVRRAGSAARSTSTGNSPLCPRLIRSCRYKGERTVAFGHACESPDEPHLQTQSRAIVLGFTKKIARKTFFVGLGDPRCGKRWLPDCL